MLSFDRGDLTHANDPPGILLDQLADSGECGARLGLTVVLCAKSVRDLD